LHSSPPLLPDHSPGGRPTSAFSRTTGIPDTTTIILCPNGQWTQELASFKSEQCLTPPGHYTLSNGTFPCPDGSFRADWKFGAEASACTACGEGVKAYKTDQVTAYRLADNVAYQVAITTAAEDCCECLGALCVCWAVILGL
jgi:hypothetical protein